MNSIHPILLEILKSRGAKSESEIEEFLSPKPKLTHDPYLLHNMEEGVDLILQNIEMQNKICIYGDYDADGVTATSLLLKFLSGITSNITYHIPSRFKEGYGLNSETLDKIKKEGTELIITVDCGSVSYNEVEHAKAIGLQILVTDHHNLNDKPANCLIINPKQEMCNYPNKNLSGCGVAFKLAQAIQRKLDLPKASINELLDLVAIATIGDIVPLLGENRTLIKYGMELFNKCKHKGLASLIEETGLQPGQINSESVAYVIVPHLNAAGRMGNAGICVELLTDKDPIQVSKNVNALIESNKERKTIQEETLKKCISIVEINHKEDLFLLVDAEDAHEGITGIVAGKLKDIYKKPSVIFSNVTSDLAGEKEMLLKGTGRSIETVDLYEMLNKYSYLYEKFGGHSGACGLSMKAENLGLLREKLNEDLKNLAIENPNLFNLNLNVAGDLTIQDVNEEFVENLWKLAPFGQGNEKPIFQISNVIANNVNFLGNEGQHVKFSLSQKESKSINCILFNKAKEYYNLLSEKESINIFGTPDFNNYKGTKTIQIIIGEIKKSN